MNICQKLRDTQTRTLAYFSLAASQLDLRYGPEEWSVRFILHHLRPVGLQRVMRQSTSPLLNKLTDAQLPACDRLISPR
jgi:hypothetical protein